MKVASVSEAKNRLSALLDLVRAGETVLIADRGTPVARLEAVPSAPDVSARLARLERAGLVRRGRGQTIGALREPAPPVAPDQGEAALSALIEERRSGR